MNFVNLLSMSYWFSQPFAAYGWVKWFWVLIFLALVLAGLIFKIICHNNVDKLKKEVWRRGGNLSLTIGILGLIWLFFRQEHIPFLSWRFWLLILLVIFVWWLCNIIIYVVKRLPEINDEKRRREELNKYLPGKK